MMFADVTFTTEGLAVVTVVVGTLWGALVVVWKRDIDHRDRLAAELREDKAQLLAIILEHGLRGALPAHLSPPVSPASGSGRHRPLTDHDPDE